MTHIAVGRLDFVPEDRVLIPQWRAFLQELHYDHTIEQAAKLWYLALFAGGYKPKYLAYQYTWAWLRRNKPRLEVEDLVEDEARRVNQYNNNQRVSTAFRQVQEELPQVPEAVLERIWTALFVRYGLISQCTGS